ncbi:MAG TPA: DUF1598 domain-containing protein [Pirellulales bacterium]
MVAARVVSPIAASGAESDPAILLQAYIDAGEFAPAINLANAATEGAPAKHDAILAAVSEAQAAAGDRRSALQSASQISDDRMLTDTLGVVRTKPAKMAGQFGGNQADFDSLIDLITSTIAAPTWTDVGGQGSIMPFPNGVYIDPQGVLRSQIKDDRTATLAMLRNSSLQRLASSDVRKASALRKVSLVQLERQVALRAAQGLPPTEEMQFLGGLQRIQYVLVYPEQGDLVLAGPAGDWQMDRDGRMVGKESNRPLLSLDDLVVILRHCLLTKDARFGCSIAPTQASLADVQEFVKESNKTPLKPGQRDVWLRHLREKLGKQDIEVDGIDPRTRAGLVMVEADYRMKLVGMGLEEGVLGVPSYLSMIRVPPGQPAPPMDVLRWWFTLNYDAVVATAEHDAFELRGQGVQVLSENEMLTAAGQRVHTGNSDDLNREFAHNFTKHFAELAVKYPIYADLRNLCDMALASTLLRNENIPDKIRWHLLCFGDPQRYQVPLAAAPNSVETVINHRVVNQSTIIVGVSGGVQIDPNSFVKPSAIKTDDYGRLKAERLGSTPKKEMGVQPWWWD